MKFTKLKMIYLLIIVSLFVAFSIVAWLVMPMALGKYTWIGYVITILLGLVFLFLFVKKHSIFIGTNEALVVQGFENGFYSGSDRPSRLGSVFFYWPKFIFRSTTIIPLSTQVIPLKRFENGQEVDVATTSKDGMLVKIVGSFEFQITNPILFYNKMWENSITWEKCLEKSGSLFSRILETYVEYVVSRDYELEDMDSSKKEISKRSLERMQKDLAEDEFAEYGVRIVRLHITDFGGDDIVAFRKNEAEIQEQQNQLALSEEAKKTKLGILENEKIVLEKEKEVIASRRVVNESEAEMKKSVKVIDASADAEVLKIDLAAKKEFEEIFKYVNTLSEFVESVKADASRYPALNSLIGNSGGLESLVSAYKMFQQAVGKQAVNQ